MNNTKRITKKVTFLDLLIGALLSAFIVITLYIIAESIGLLRLRRTNRTKYYENGSYSGEFLNGK
jgi:hypothetical protein